MKWSKKHNRNWHNWFAWYPIFVWNGLIRKWIWLEYILRKADYCVLKGASGWFYEYKERS